MKHCFYRRLLLVLALPLTQCGTPKGLDMDPSKVLKMKPMEQVGHLWRVSIGSALRSPITTADAAVTVLAQRTHALICGTVPLPGIDVLPDDAPRPGTEAFEALLDAQKLPARTSGRVRLLVDGDAFFSELFDQVKNASVSIDSQVFIFDNDDISVKYADLLREKAAHVPVRVFIDTLGTRVAHRVKPDTPPPPGFQAPDYIGDYLTQGSKIKLRATTNPVLLCDHTKLHIIDHRVALLGGMNIGREYLSEWHDLMATVEGRVVKDLENIFQGHWDGESWVRNWTLQNFFAKSPSAAPVPPVADNYPLRVLRTDITKGRKEIVHAFRIAVQAARKRVWIHTPYLAEEGMISDFIDAAKRGIDVRIIMPSTNDSGVMQTVNHTNAARLIEAGVKVYAYPRMTHMKVVLCDDWAMFGSANCDTLSLKLNRELNLASSARPFVRAIERQIFLRDFPVSKRVSRTKAEQQSSIFGSVVGNQL